MKIKGIQDFSKTKYSILFENGLILVLYKADVRRYHLEEGADVTDKQVKILLEEILPYRAKMRCMKLLQGRDYTEEEIRKKLNDDGYPEDIIKQTIDYLYGYHYLDDERYIRLYYQSKKHRKSKKEMIQELQRKGIAKELVVRFFETMHEEQEENSDLYCIRKLLCKKKYDDESASFEEKEKIKAYLYRKGFEISDIITAMKNFSWNNM